MKRILLSGLIVAALAVAAWTILKSAASRETAPTKAERVAAANLAASAQPVVAAASASSAEPASSVPENAPAQPSPKEKNAAPGVTTNSAPAKKPKEPLRDPDAREALALVGVDPDAEAYWLGAIYDSSLPAQEREDLIEDLNEDGLSDKKNPGPQDLPVILNRLALIEDIVPTADDFMLEHLREAYKDLVNLARITQGGGEPVR